MITKTEQTTQEKSKEDKQVLDKEENLLNDLVELDEPVDEEPEEEESEEEAGEDEEAEETEETEETEEETEETKDDEEDEEDLIPRSKVDKRFAQLTAEKKALEARLKALEERQSENKDPEMAKLEAMNKEQVKNLLEELEVEKFKAIKDDDDATYKRLRSLEKKARDVIDNAPKREAELRSKSWSDAVESIKTDPDIKLDDKVAGQIKSYATMIYQKSPSLQKTPTGEAEALIMAAEHFKSLNKAPKSTGDKALKRKVNQLKKKTALDGKTIKGDLKQQSNKKLYHKAKKQGADEYDKLDYFVKSGIVDMDSL